MKKVKLTGHTKKSLPVLKILIVSALVVITCATGFYSISHFKKYKADIVIQIADVLQTIALPYRIAKLSALPPDLELEVPVYGVKASQIEDNWGDPRSGGRTHKGIDIFARRGTPVYAASPGFVMRKGTGELGGNYIFTVGAGGRRYYYAHLDSFASNIEVGLPVTTETVLGYVGNTGNAITTPPHLHFGMYVPGEGAQNPYEFLVESVRNSS